MPHERVGRSYEYMKHTSCFNDFPQALRHTDKKDQKEEKHHKSAHDKASKACCSIFVSLLVAAKILHSVVLSFMQTLL